MNSDAKRPEDKRNKENGSEGEPPRRRAWQAPTPRNSTGKPSQSMPIQAAPGAPATPARPAPARPAPAPKGSSRAGTPPSQPSKPTKPQPGPALVSRGERILFWTLLAAVLAMSLFLVRYRQQVDAHFQSRALAVPLAGAAANSSSPSPAEPLLLYLANDDTGTLTERPLAFPLPDDPNTRARVVLEKLLSEYTAPGSPHPLKAAAPGVEGVDEVYLVPAPGSTLHSALHVSSAGSRPLLAVVDLTPNFVHTHPSGIEPETLTLLSMIATLHANLPSVTEVRFLVDGEPRTTLAGHADLSRTYLAGAVQMAPPEAFTNTFPDGSSMRQARP